MPQSFNLLLQSYNPTTTTEQKKKSLTLLKVLKSILVKEKRMQKLSGVICLQRMIYEFVHVEHFYSLSSAYTQSELSSISSQYLVIFLIWLYTGYSRKVTKKSSTYSSWIIQIFNFLFIYY